MNAVQRDRFAAVAAAVEARRYSLANSAGICLGRDYALRPGSSRPGALRRRAARGSGRAHRPGCLSRGRGRPAPASSAPAKPCGYGATWTAEADTEAAIVNIGYADGYLRCFAGKGSASVDGKPLPLIGRVSMDLIALDVSAAPELAEGDWVTLDYDLPYARRSVGPVAI